uniref:non-specific serine/threonine protein kinase n=1 Tax=Naja naja TaxID=35670 RepID=A0A8C6VKK5_NAJNA
QKKLGFLPKTFPATTYSGNSRQRLQEIREGLKQPAKSSSQGLPIGPSSESSLDSKILVGKDAARQQQIRPAAKFGNYQKALREIRYSLLPFANELGTTSAVVEVNRQMLQELVNAGCDQEMAIRALKQTGSRSIEAALEYISKMGYLDPRNEQIVRVINIMPSSVSRRPSFEGSTESFSPYHQITNPAYEGTGFGAESANVLGDVPRPYMDYLLSASQSATMNAPVQRPPCLSSHNTPGNLQQKAYPTNMDSSVISYPVAGHSNQALQLQGSHGSNSPHYGRQPVMVQNEGLGYGIQRTAVAPNNSGHGFQQAPAGLYMPHSHHKQPIPSSHPIHVITRGAPFSNEFSDSPPQSLLTPSRNSLNMDLYDLNNSQIQQWQSQALEASPRQHVPFRPDACVPSRTNSFNNHQPQMPVPMRQTASGKTEASIPSPNTITAVTATHILQPVKSTRVMRPEPQTAVGPAHPGWLPAQSSALDSLGMMEQHPLPVGGANAYQLDVDYSNQELRCPPPPYPKHLLLPNSSEQFDINCLPKSEKVSKDKKQIQTSPVPVRKNGKDEEKRESRIKSYSPFAFKFYMEQHVENVIKTYQQKMNRRLQLEQEMAKAGLCEAEQEQMRKILYQKESNYNRLKRAKMDKSMFVKIKTLGIGAFGEVCLACKVDTHALYAMKTLRKKDVLNRNQVAHVKAERDILAEADNEWVVKLYYSFQDKDNLYFVMDYIPGGDMMSLLIRMEVFPEKLAQFYIAELTLAIESVHKMGFIHRDIKPDNILIDLDGHIKLTDFGLCTGFRWTHNSKYYQKGSHIRQDSMEPSDLWDDVSNCRCGDRLKTLEQRAKKQHQRCLAHSLVGTPNYIAPEVLLRKGYTQLCDWWSVGVILFEMLVGQPPFLASTPTETQLKVINWENTLHIPSQIKLSPEASDLITKLCCSAEERLGRNGADDIKAHTFFDSIDFSTDIRRQPAPYVPKISHPMDTSNFDPVEEDGPWDDSSEDNARAWDPQASSNGKHTEHAFYEFTFRRFFDDNGYPFRYPKPSGLDISQSKNPDIENKDGLDQNGACQPVYV